MGREGEKEGLLAVLLGDLYSNNLAPLTITSPLSLLPVAGRPLLDITLDSLRLAGVTEVTVSSSFTVSIATNGTSFYAGAVVSIFASRDGQVLAGFLTLVKPALPPHHHRHCQ